MRFSESTVSRMTNATYGTERWDGLSALTHREGPFLGRWPRLQMARAFGPKDILLVQRTCSVPRCGVCIHRAAAARARYNGNSFCSACGSFRVSNCAFNPGSLSENSSPSADWRSARWTMPIFASRLSIIETNTASGVAA